MSCKPLTFRLEVMCLISSILRAVNVSGKVGMKLPIDFLWKFCKLNHTASSFHLIYQEFFILGEFRNITEDSIVHTPTKLCHNVVQVLCEELHFCSVTNGQCRMT
jgi:hypothetical protein